MLPSNTASAVAKIENKTSLMLCSNHFFSGLLNPSHTFMYGHHLSVKSSYESKKIRCDSSLLFLVIESSQKKPQPKPFKCVASMNTEHCIVIYIQTLKTILEMLSGLSAMLFELICSIVIFTYFDPRVSNNNVN